VTHSNNNNNEYIWIAWHCHWEIVCSVKCSLYVDERSGALICICDLRWRDVWVIHVFTLIPEVETIELHLWCLAVRAGGMYSGHLRASRRLQTGTDFKPELPEPIVVVSTLCGLLRHEVNWLVHFVGSRWLVDGFWSVLQIYQEELIWRCVVLKLCFRLVTLVALYNNNYNNNSNNKKEQYF